MTTPTRSLLIFTFAGLFMSRILFAQSLDDSSAQAHWRAASRLGYSVSSTADTGSAKAWGLEQLRLAQEASKQAPTVPEALQLLNLSASEVSRKVHEENEARRTARLISEVRAASMPAQTTDTMNAALGSDKMEFIRDMERGITAWRLNACSQADFEQPMLARMTEFWFNHFNVFIKKGSVRPFVANYVLQAIRPHALGKFEDLLLATAQHPAMLFYLDQNQSNARGLNENYARELMELHTLGVNGGYTQQDVQALARILTGWSVDIQGGAGFVFRPKAHQEGAQTLMGTTFAQTGQDQGIAAIRFLARQPATAARIAARLATFFVADQAPPALVERLAASYLQSEGDIAVVMRTLIESPEFWDKNNQLFKTPMDFACSGLSAMGKAPDLRGQEQNFRQAVNFLQIAGQALHGWQTPDGYKTDAATWLAPEALTRRADFAFNLAPRMQEPTFLQPYFGSKTIDRISQEGGVIRTALWLSAPDFMRK